MTGKTLRFAVRPQVVLKYLGQLFLVLAALTLVPYAVSLSFGDMDLSLRYAFVLAGLSVTGFCLRRFPQPKSIQANEAMVLIALMFLFTPLIMAYPMTACGISYEAALFEAISAGTTTGLSTLSSVEDKPGTFLFARAWMQWYGGLGIVVFALAVLVQPGRITKGLAVSEEGEDDLVGGTRAHARYVLKVYSGLTVAGIGALLLTGTDAFDAVVHTFSAVSTGGFSPYDKSLGDLQGSSSRVVVVVLCLAGSLSFVFYRRIIRRGWRPAIGDLQTHAVLLTCLLTSLLLGLSMWFTGRGTWTEVAFHAPMLGISAQTTAGFSTMSPSQLSASSKLILILSMALGGGIGSTAGGFKILRLIIAVYLLYFIAARTSMPAHTYVTPRLGGQKLETSEINHALTLIFSFVTLIFLSWIPFAAAGYDPLDSLFEVVSSVGTVGLSTGITASNLPSPLKWILCIDMLMGRLEIVAWLVLVYPGTWLGRRRDAQVR